MRRAGGVVPDRDRWLICCSSVVKGGFDRLCLPSTPDRQNSTRGRGDPEQAPTAVGPCPALSIDSTWPARHNAGLTTNHQGSWAPTGVRRRRRRSPVTCDDPVAATVGRWAIPLTRATSCALLSDRRTPRLNATSECHVEREDRLVAATSEYRPTWCPPFPPQV